MSFISLTFALFFAAFAALYLFAARFENHAVKIQNILLLAASIAFYAFADLRFLPFLAHSIAVTYFAGLFCKNKAAFFAFIAADLAPLLFFKYSPIEWRGGLVFPLGLSFFTFQSVGYVADCRKGKIQPERNPLAVAQFICFFPVISSGPIQRAGDFIPQLGKVHRFDYDDAADGMKLFAWGMFKKLCVADKLALYVNHVYGSPADKSGLALLLATVLYSFQIYCDFSGYSDMAVGAAKLLGFDAGKNFDHPYLADSVGNFWRRWHISLSSWLRDYVYIPLGGSRVPLPRIYLNLLATFFVSGIWHGSTWNFVVWGLLHGLYQCAGRAAKPLLERAKAPAFAKVLATFCLVSFAWIFFRARNLSDAITVVQGLGRIPEELLGFAELNGSIGAKEAVKELFALNDSGIGGIKGMAKCLVLLAIFIAASFSTNEKSGLETIKKRPIAVRWILYIALFSILLPSIVTNTNSEFLYFSF